MGGRVVRTNRGVSRYRPYVAAGLRLAGKAYKAYSNRQTSSNRSQTQSHMGLGVTSQHDSRQVYKKRRMPAKKRKRWTKFIKKVQAVEEKSKATRSVVFNDLQQMTNGGSSTTLKQQAFFFFPLYSCKSTFQGGGSSLQDREIYSDLNRVVTSEFNAAGNTNVRRLHFMAAILDITFAGQTTIATPTELDLYYIQFRKDVYHSSFNLFLLEQQNMLPGTPNAARLDMAGMGVTPFEFPTLCSTVRIIKKEKIIVAPGQIVTRQWRIPKNKSLYSKDFRHLNQNFAGTSATIDQDMFAQRNWTCGILAIAKGTPTANSERPVDLQVGFTRTYHYKVYEYSADASGYKPTVNAVSLNAP